MIEVKELSPAVVRLEAQDYEYLLRLTPPPGEDELVIPAVFDRIAPTSEPGSYRVNVGPYVGRVGLPSGESIDIQSRFSFEDLVALLRRSGRVPAHVDFVTAVEDRGPFIVDALVYAFVREVERVAAQGLAKGYERRVYTRPPYVGRPDITAHVQRDAARPDRLTTVGRAITMNTAENQAVRRAFDVLVGTSMRPLVARRLARIAPVVRAVSRVPMSAADIRAIPDTPLNRRYAHVLSLAEVVLQSRELIPAGLGLPGASMLFHMPTVWEACVLNWIREDHPDWDVVPQHPIHIAAGRRPGRADVLAFVRGVPVALFDAKYKHHVSGPTNSDIYQMIAYCDLLGLEEATLVYPGATEPQTLYVGRRRIHVLGLPL